MSMRSQYEKKMRFKVRDKVKKKVAWKRGQDEDSAPQRQREIPIEEAMAAVPNEQFFTDAFEDSHISRNAPNPDDAIAVAVARGVDPSTTIFLEGGDYQALADDIRAFHSRQFRKRGQMPMFTTEGTYPYITVTGAPGAPVASAVTHGRISFNMRLNTGVAADLGHGSAPVYAIHHLQEMFETGQDDGAEASDDNNTVYDYDSDS